MLKNIQQFFTQLHASADAPHTDDNIQLAAVALLVELMVTDDKITDSEQNTLIDLLANEFGVEHSKIDEIIELAEAEVKDSNDLYQFTRLINDHYSNTQKFTLLKALWQIAYADDELDKYEEYTIRKIAELLYIPHADFIRAKLEVNAIAR